MAEPGDNNRDEIQFCQATAALATRVPLALHPGYGSLHPGYGSLHPGYRSLY